MVSYQAEMYVSTFLRLFAYRLPLLTKWFAVKSAASAVSTARVKKKRARKRVKLCSVKKRERLPSSFFFFLFLVWSSPFPSRGRKPIKARAVLRRGCTENEIALGSVCIIFREYGSPAGSRFFFHE